MFRKKHPEVGAKPGSLVLSPDAKPPVIRVVDYDQERHDVIEGLAVDDLDPYLDTPSVTWIDLRGLGDHAVLEHLARKMNIHPLALEDAVNVPVRPKAELYENFHLIVLQMDRYLEGERLERSQFTLFVGKNTILTMQEAPDDVFEKVRQRTEVGPRMRSSGPDYLAYALIDYVIDAYYPLLEVLSARVENLEDEVMLDARRDHVLEIIELRQHLQELRRDMEPMRDLVSSLLREESPFFTPAVLTFMRDCYDHAAQIVEGLQSDLESTSQLISLHSAMMGNKMNEIMKVLTIMSTIFIPLTFLAGIYGMNFVNMPELEWRYGYFVVLGVMVVVALALLGIFRRKGWLRND